MTEGTYEYECMRAELLGIQKPDYDEFMKNKQEKEVQEIIDEEIDTEHIKDVDHQSEGIKNISGGLDELNSILQVTQRKINKFKASCGSLTNLLKIKIGHGSTDASCSSSIENESQPAQDNTVADICSKEDTEKESSQNGAPVRKSDLTKALDNNIDRLDAMVEKAENIQYSMAHQNKQMRKFLN